MKKFAIAAIAAIVATASMSTIAEAGFRNRVVFKQNFHNGFHKKFHKKFRVRITFNQRRFHRH